ncbi:MAG TPA: hypothetical protein VLH15_07360 [Dehalococcoidales bacterium]|nr:hypothetical protein [Dehalococcoidales bacterium]
MSDFKHGKYVVTQPKQNLVVPQWGGNLSAETSTRVMYLDSEVIKGAFYVECVWFWPTDREDKGSPDPHTHNYDEVIGFFGTDPKDLNDLGAEIELYIDGERNLMNQTFLAFIPRGIVHCPLNILKITRPVFHFATGQGKSYANG